MNSPLEGRVALVTGASAGIGRAVVNELTKLGAGVVANARRSDKLAELERGSSRVKTVAGNASLPETVRDLFTAVQDFFGADPDIVVVNAGRGLDGSVLSSDPNQWREIFDLNVLGAAHLMRKAASVMSESARCKTKPQQPQDIVVIGSTVGRNVSPFSSMYGATKFALHSLTEALRRELAPKGIRVTLIEPGVVMTEFQAVAGYSQQLVSTLTERFGPLLEPEDVARAISFTLAQPAHVHISDINLRPTRQDYP